MVTYLGGSIFITIFALGGSIVSYNLHYKILPNLGKRNLKLLIIN